MTVLGKACSTCRYWRHLGPVGLVREASVDVDDCRRSPPRLTHMPEAEVAQEHNLGRLWMLTRFPVTPNGDWRGKWVEHPDLIRAGVDAAQPEMIAKYGSITPLQSDGRRYAFDPEDEPF